MPATMVDHLADPNLGDIIAGLIRDVSDLQNTTATTAGNTSALQAQLDNLPELFVPRGQIDPSDFVNGRVDGQAIAQDAIDTVHLIEGAVTDAIIAAGAVGATHIGAAVIGVTHIGVAAIRTAAIRNLAVISAKIASVDAGLINAGTINVALTLNAATINAGTITGGQLTIGNQGDPTAAPGTYFRVQTNGKVTMQQTTVDGVNLFEAQYRPDIEAVYGYSGIPRGIAYPFVQGRTLYVSGGTRIADAPFRSRFVVGDPNSAASLAFDDISLQRFGTLNAPGTLTIQPLGGSIVFGEAETNQVTTFDFWGDNPVASVLRVWNRAGTFTDSPRGIDIIMGASGATNNPQSDDQFLRFRRGDLTVLDTFHGDSAGGIRFSGEAAGTYSDVRLKADIVDGFDPDLEHLFDKVPWASFTWAADGRRSHGVLAQPMLDHPVLAEAVSVPEAWPDHGFLRVDKAQLVPILAARIMALEARLAALEAQRP